MLSHETVRERMGSLETMCWHPPGTARGPWMALRTQGGCKHQLNSLSWGCSEVFIVISRNRRTGQLDLMHGNYMRLRLE